MAGEALVTDFSLEIYRGTPDGDHQGGILDQVIEVFYAATDFPPPQRPHYRGRVPEVVDRGAPELLGGAGRVPHILIQSLREVQDLVILSRVLLVPGHDLWRRRRVAAVRDGDPPQLSLARVASLIWPSGEKPEAPSISGFVHAQLVNSEGDGPLQQ